MATANRLVFKPFVDRLVTSPFVFHLLFTSFVTKRFASQTRLLGGDDWLFFNYGYEEDPPMALPLADTPMRLLSRADIDAQVLRGNEKNSPRKHDLIGRHGPAIPRGLTRYASDVTDWAFNGALQRGEFTYRVYCLARD